MPKSLHEEPCWDAEIVGMAKGSHHGLTTLRYRIGLCGRLHFFSVHLSSMLVSTKSRGYFTAPSSLSSNWCCAIINLYEKAYELDSDGN
jgi:hypothetical protein